MSDNGGFDAVTLWYVIEHFEEAGKALTEIHGLLKDGGALAFSTPSYSGISGKKSIASFLENSPPDHFAIWSPKICAWILRRYGFRLRKIVVTGHHPERFPLLGRFADPAKKGTLYRFLLLISRLFRLGDTFEVYAVKG
jgi:SAM-dependent methyltransferase